MTKPKIYCFVNSGKGTDWQMVMAMSEDGDCLAEHCSSSYAWARHDIGFESDWKHDIYKTKYPEGYELEWVDDPKSHPGLMTAYALNQKKGAIA